jgi:LmbE family N-acetylglucosaminyl deacetylase
MMIDWSWEFTWEIMPAMVRAAIITIEATLLGFVLAAVLGLAGVDRLGLPDGEVTNDVTLRAQLVALVRTHRPEMVVAPDPTAVFFGDSYVNHRDHREVGWAAIDAVAPAAASPLYFPATGAAHHVRIMLLSGSLAPAVGVDISTVVDKKLAAVQCHESRVGGDPALVGQLIRARTAEAGASLGVGHAESFRRLRFG